MTDRAPPVVLRLEPHAIPAVRAAVGEALAELTPHLARLRHVGFLAEAWLGDEVSEEVRTFYNDRVMAADDGPYAALRAYERELTGVHDTLTQLAEHYRRTEGENAARWGRV